MKKFEFGLAIAIVIGMIMCFTGSLHAQGVVVKSDSIGSNGSVNQVVVVNSSPSKRGVGVRLIPTTTNNYYSTNDQSHCCLRYHGGPVDPANQYQEKSKLDYVDVWLIVLSVLFALGLGIFLGYLIWRNRQVAEVVVHSHGGRSSSSSSTSSSSSSTRGYSRHVGSSSNPPASSVASPIQQTPLAPTPGSAPAEEEKK